MLRALIVALPDVAKAVGTAPHDAGRAPPPAGGVLAASTSVQMLIALSAAEPAVDRRRRMAADADKGLRQLERLHRDLLQGVASPGRLRELGEWAALHAPPDDPELAAIAREIDVRVRVELAKHERLV